MIKIGILGDIGSGKSYVAKQFGYPVFNADNVVSKLYKKDKKVFKKLQKTLPKFIFSYPLNKSEIAKAILANGRNLNKIIKIVHFEVRKKLGNKTENGKLMFVYQALLAFNVWHGIKPEINDEVINLLDQ